ncbi:hypothetical protein G7Y79_00060g092130 [Physcia stellaris]|nr:hypothetical protein G7Y79_00060g092130 [Physcia stellaris]
MSVTSILAMDETPGEQYTMARDIEGAIIYDFAGNDRIRKWIMSLPNPGSDPGPATSDETLGKERPECGLQISSRSENHGSSGSKAKAVLPAIDRDKTISDLDAEGLPLSFDQLDPREQTPVWWEGSRRTFPEADQRTVSFMRTSQYELTSIGSNDENVRNADVRISPESPIPSVGHSSSHGRSRPGEQGSNQVAQGIVQNAGVRISPESPLPSMRQSNSQDESKLYEHNSNHSAVEVTQDPNIRISPESPLPSVRHSGPEVSTWWPTSTNAILEDDLERSRARHGTPCQ